MCPPELIADARRKRIIKRVGLGVGIGAGAIGLATAGVFVVRYLRRR